MERTVRTIAHHLPVGGVPAILLIELLERPKTLSFEPPMAMRADLVRVTKTLQQQAETTHCDDANIGSRLRRGLLEQGEEAVGENEMAKIAAVS